MKMSDRNFRTVVLFTLWVLSAFAGFSQPSSHKNWFNIRDFGARGDGKSVDSKAINETINAASLAGGGTVYFPAGTYLSFSIRLKSNISLYLDQGSVLLAAEPGAAGRYDSVETGANNKFQDFGHSHWHNSLIWGENLDNISILGPGLIHGKGLSRGFYKEDHWERIGVDPGNLMMEGSANKAIALKLCRNVIMKDFTILNGGHFGILATGVSNLTIDNLKMDTNRDGIDIDCCNNVRVSNCSINSPYDDAICLKSSFALGFARATENVTITNSQVSGYDEGTFLNGTYKRDHKRYSHNSTTGRIKFGTESNGGFKNITISNIVFEYSRGLALETVDGGLLEDVAITNITMRDIVNPPIFIRLGKRNRGPKETMTEGKLRRVIISNVVAYNAEAKYASIISGIPGNDIEDLHLSNIRIYYKGGGTRQQAALVPPEKEEDYPEPVMFGEMPAYGFFVRHVKGLSMNDVEVSFMTEDVRPAFVLIDVKGADFHRVKAQRLNAEKTFVLKNVSDFNASQVWLVPDTRIDLVKEREL